MARLALRRNERLFSRGQRVMGQEPSAAVEPLQQSAQAAPRDAQVRLFFAMALADAGRPDEALAILQEAQAIEPRNAVLLAETGVVHLDEGRPQDALAVFERAAAAAPENALCVTWPLLARWDLGDGAAAAELSRRTRDRTSRFQARVLVRVERGFLTGQRPPCARDASPPPLQRTPGLLDRLWDGPRVRRKARSLLARGNFDAAASILLQAREDHEGDSLLDGLLPGALQGALTEVTKELQSITGTGASIEADRREALFRLGDSLLQLERWSEAASRLDEWYASHIAAGSPVGEVHYAFAVAIAASETASKLGRWDSGLEWAGRARAIEPDRKETLRADALARVGIGHVATDRVVTVREHRAARRLFERFLDGSLYTAEDRLRELITGTKAFIAT